MGRWRAASLLWGGVVFAIGTVIAISRSDLSNALGFGGFAVSIFASFLMRRSSARSSEIGTREGSVWLDGVELPALELPYSRSRLRLGLVLWLGLTEAFLSLAHGRWSVLCLVAAAFSALLALLTLRNLFVPPSVALSEKALHVRSAAGHRWALWDDLYSFRIDAGKYAPMMRLDAAHSVGFEGPWWARLISMSEARRRMIVIALDPLSVDPDQLQRTIRTLVKNPAARPGIATRGLM
jgi:hypothetical protein